LQKIVFQKIPEYEFALSFKTSILYSIYCLQCVIGLFCNIGTQLVLESLITVSSGLIVRKLSSRSLYSFSKETDN